MVGRWQGAASRSLVMHADPLAAYAYRWLGGFAPIARDRPLVRLVLAASARTRPDVRHGRLRERAACASGFAPAASAMPRRSGWASKAACSRRRCGRRRCASRRCAALGLDADATLLARHRPLLGGEALGHGDARGRRGGTQAPGRPAARRRRAASGASSSCSPSAPATSRCFRGSPTASELARLARERRRAGPWLRGRDLLHGRGRSARERNSADRSRSRRGGRPARRPAPARSIAPASADSLERAIGRFIDRGPELQRAAAVRASQRAHHGRAFRGSVRALCRAWSPQHAVQPAVAAAVGVFGACARRDPARCLEARPARAAALVARRCARTSSPAGKPASTQRSSICLQRPRDDRPFGQAARDERAAADRQARGRATPAICRCVLRLAGEQQPIDCAVDADAIGERLRRDRRCPRRRRRRAALRALFDSLSRAAIVFGDRRVARAAAPRDGAAGPAPMPASRSLAMSASRSASRSALDLRKDRPQDAALEHDRDGRRRDRQAPSSFRSSSAMRSRDRAMRSLARAVQASSAAASGSPAPKRAWKRKKRRIRR